MWAKHARAFQIQREQSRICRDLSWEDATTTGMPAKGG